MPDGNGGTAIRERRLTQRDSPSAIRVGTAANGNAAVRFRTLTHRDSSIARRRGPGGSGSAAADGHRLICRVAIAIALGINWRILSQRFAPISRRNAHYH